MERTSVTVREQSRRHVEFLRFLRAPERLALANILLLALSIIAVLFLLDAGVFRTFYWRYIKPQSYAGAFEIFLRIGREKQFTRQHRALMLGNSQMGEGFSARVADEVGAKSGWEFLNVAAGGISMRSWYYMVRDLDPDRTRFDVIVLPLPGFSDVDDGWIHADDEFDLRVMIARLRLSDVHEFTASFVKRATKTDVLRESLFEGLVYLRDLRDLLRKPGDRMRSLVACRADCAGGQYAYEGHTEDLSGLWVDWASGTVHFPPGLREQARAEMNVNWDFRGFSVRGIERAYRKAWLGRIIDRYRGTRTRIVIISLPYRPLPIPFSWPVDSDSFVAQASKNPAVTVLDEHFFDDLQRPDYFWDGLHMNRKGRDLFSRRLAAALIQRFDPHSEL